MSSKLTKPGKVSKVIHETAITEERAEIQIESADPVHAKIRIVNFSSDELGKTLRLKEGDGVDVIVGSDNPSGSRSSQK